MFRGKLHIYAKVSKKMKVKDLCRKLQQLEMSGHSEDEIKVMIPEELLDDDLEITKVRIDEASASINLECDVL